MDNNTIKGWVRGDDETWYNIAHFSEFKVEKNHLWDGWSIAGLRDDGEELYIRTFKTWGECTLYLIKVMERKNG